MGFYPTGIRKTISLRILQCARKLRKGKYSLKNCTSYMSSYGWIKHSKAISFYKEYKRELSFNYIKGIIRIKLNLLYKPRKRMYISLTRLMMKCDLLKLCRSH